MPARSATDSTAPTNDLHVETPQGSIFVRQVPGEVPPGLCCVGRFQRAGD